MAEDTVTEDEASPLEKEVPVAPPLTPAQATKALRELVQKPGGPGLFRKLHFKQRLIERGLIIGDVLHLLKYGYVYDSGYESSRPGCYKYDLEGTTPNSDNRVVKVVVILPGEKGNDISLVTIMWKDEDK